MRTHYPYTREEVKYVLQNFQTLTYPKIAEYLNRTTKCVKHLVRNLNFYKTDPKLTDQEIEDILDKSLLLNLLIMNSLLKIIIKIILMWK